MSRNYMKSEAFRDQVSRDLRSDAEFERRQRENRLNDGLVRELTAQADYERALGGKIVTVNLLLSAAARIADLEARVAKADAEEWGEKHV